MMVCATPPMNLFDFIGEVPPRPMEAPPQQVMISKGQSTSIVGSGLEDYILVESCDAAILSSDWFEVSVFNTTPTDLATLCAKK